MFTFSESWAIFFFCADMIVSSVNWSLFVSNFIKIHRYLLTPCELESVFRSYVYNDNVMYKLLKSTLIILCSIGYRISCHLVIILAEIWDKKGVKGIAQAQSSTYLTKGGRDWRIGGRRLYNYVLCKSALNQRFLKKIV